MPSHLLIWGADDRIVPPLYADRFRAILPNARLELIPECGHLPMFEQPVAFAAAVTRFLDSRS